MSDSYTAPIHPGVHLAEILGELGISQHRFAKAIGVTPSIIKKIIDGQNAITGDTALRIGKALRMTPDSWLNLQKLYELEKARDSTDVSQVEPLVPQPKGIPSSETAD